MNERAPLTRNGKRIMAWEKLPRLIFLRSRISAMEDPRHTIYRIQRLACREINEAQDYKKTNDNPTDAA